MRNTIRRDSTRALRVTDVELETPRDRQASFEPKIVRKRQTRWTGFDNKILSVYAGMTTRDPRPLGTDLREGSE
jgi:putative transposase